MRDVRTASRYRALVAGLTAVASTAHAGDWHAGARLVCSDCHTMHNSNAGRPMRYDEAVTPAPGLLRAGSADALCVYCHDGSHPGAPDVMSPVSYVADPAGGAFTSPPGVASPTAHDLAMMTAATPPGGTEPMTLTCTTCHQPHGTGSFRNLRGDPSGSGKPPVTVTATETVAPDGTNAAQVYVAANIIYRAGMSAWCATCHGAFHGKAADAEGFASPWLRHPQDVRLSSARNLDYAFWSGAQTTRVRVESPLDDLVPSDDDEVFCLTCHKAHGSPHRASTIFADGARLSSTCEQCHNP